MSQTSRWRCNECGEEFTEPNEDEICLESEYGVGFEHGRHYETFYTCPYCCSDDIDVIEGEDEEENV